VDAEWIEVFTPRIKRRGSGLPKSLNQQSQSNPQPNDVEGVAWGKRKLNKLASRVKRILAAKPIQHESIEQCAFIEWVDLQKNNTPELELIFAIPNGGLRNPRVAGRLKLEGVRPGVPDLMFAYPNGKYHGLYIEMKWGYAKPSKSQKEWHKRLRDAGYKVVIPYSCQEAIDETNAYLSLGC